MFVAVFFVVVVVVDGEGVIVVFVVDGEVVVVVVVVVVFTSEFAGEVVVGAFSVDVVVAVFIVGSSTLVDVPEISVGDRGAAVVNEVGAAHESEHLKMHFLLIAQYFTSQYKKQRDQC